MIDLEFRNVDFFGGKKTGERGERPLKRIKDKLNSHMTGIEPEIERRASCRNATHASHTVQKPTLACIATTQPLRYVPCFKTSAEVLVLTLERFVLNT
jgi:hypothetical protein